MVVEILHLAYVNLACLEWFLEEKGNWRAKEGAWSWC